MDKEIIILSKVSLTEKDKYHMIALICGWTLCQFCICEL